MPTCERVRVCLCICLHRKEFVTQGLVRVIMETDHSPRSASWKPRQCFGSNLKV